MNIPKQLNILFIGNSLTAWNKGVGYHFEKLANSDNSGCPGIPVKTTSVTVSGVSLKYLWLFSIAREQIRTGKYHVVVLQEDLPETTVENFKKYTGLFYRECKAHGAKPVLFMTWPYNRLDRISLEEIYQAHLDITADLSIDFAPVGLLMDRIKTDRPELSLLAKDGEHPSISGTYLAAASLFHIIFKTNPVDFSYFPESAGLSKTDADYLRRCAGLPMPSPPKQQRPKNNH
ncbi:MAG: SGNH/GDSL hydrolase family protein [Desulfobacterales bacterium]|nr:SGNH/GDSL hydrolase family protein [Desulfobacterales bacterium]